MTPRKRPRPFSLSSATRAASARVQFWVRWRPPRRTATCRRQTPDRSGHTLAPRSTGVVPPLNTLDDCALAYADLLDDVGAGRLTPEEAQTISAIVAKRGQLFASIELAAATDTLKAQLAALVGPRAPPSPILRPFAIT
jgi:hypothetical protein